MLRIAMWLIGITVLSGLVPAHAETDISDRLSHAQAGETVSLPAGEFAIREISLPKQIKIRGEGYDKTFLRATDVVGLAFRDCIEGELSDLSVSGAKGSAVVIQNSMNVQLARVRLMQSLSGASVQHSDGIRIENSVACDNRTGVAMVGCKNSTIVNCTLAANSAIAASIADCENCALFNSVLASSPMGVVLGENNRALALDYNFYQVSFIGRGTDVPVPTISSWISLSGYDIHSLSQPITFENSAAHIYRPTSTPTWAQDRAATAGWGTPTLGLHRAPIEDMDGHPHQHGPCAGAYDPEVHPQREPDGYFEIAADEGRKSAGFYDQTGRNVAFLFNLLPLKRGKYPFWLPARNWCGKEISPGDYELRVTESDLSLKYIGHPGNSNASDRRDGYASTGICQLVYDTRGLPILMLNWSESYLNYRGMDENLAVQRWSIPGTLKSLGAASNGKGVLYALSEMNVNSLGLRRIDESTGQVLEAEPGVYVHAINRSPCSADASGLAVLDDVLYFTDFEKNTVFHCAPSARSFDQSFAVPGPSAPIADPERKLVWMLSERKRVVAVDPKGEIRYCFELPFDGAVGLAVRGGKLAVSSLTTGKIHLFDCSSPGAIKSERTIGTGDGPYGPMIPERLQFEGTAKFQSAQLALSPNGDIAVCDTFGPKVFDWNGKFKREFTGIWGQFIEAGLENAQGEREILEKALILTFFLDPKTKSVKSGIRYSVPKPFVGLDFFFSYQGKRYALISGASMVAIARYDDHNGVPLIAFSGDHKGHATYCDDFTRDLNNPASWKPVLDSAGKEIQTFLANPFMADPRGNLVGVGPDVMIPFKGLDSRGIPVYDFDHVNRPALKVDSENKFLSPYDGKTLDAFGSGRATGVFSDGSFVKTVALRTSNGTGMSCWAGTDMAAFDPNGKLLWFQPFAHIRDLNGAKVVDDVVYSVAQNMQELEILDKDGLFLGAMNVPPPAWWGGMCLDNSYMYTAYKGSDGKNYVVIGNFNDCTTWWFELSGLGSIRRHSTKVTTNSNLATMPPPEPIRLAAPPAVRFSIKRLDQAFPIDGSLEKWRKVIPVPQIIMTPETGSVGIKGPKDSSAVVRLAYEGNNLYVQVLKFDDVITMHQPANMFYQADAVEIAINSFTTGIKINCAHTADMGDIVLRDGWFLPSKFLPLEAAPRKITVLENARDVEERKLIEAIYGVDMSECKVLVTEFKVALNEITFEKRLEAKPTVAAGESVYIGIALDDNDKPGTSYQNVIFWPATYNTFSAKNCSALGTFE